MRRVVRWDNGQRIESMAEPSSFDSARAKQILRDGSQWASYDRHMTDGEIAFVLERWSTMPGHTSFYDALCRIAND